MALTLQPTWRKFSTNKDVRCENGDPITQILTQLERIMIDTVESTVNGMIGGANGVLDAIANPVCDVVDAVNNLVDTVARIANPGSWFGRRLQNCFGATIPELCFKTASFPNGVPGSGYCQDFTEEEALAVAQCSDTSNGLEHLCFYNRVAEICGSNSLLSQWNDLFAKGYEDFDELEAEFAEAFADSYNSLDPALTLLLQKVKESATEGPDLELRKGICSTDAFASAMT